MFQFFSQVVSRRMGASAILLALGLGALPAAHAHHGWAWADGDLVTMAGAIESISMAPPHPMLKVKMQDGKSWQVDLGNPSQTERSGFSGETAKVGDAITVLGNRHKEHDKLHIKAVRISLDGKNYDMYPERIPAK